MKKSTLLIGSLAFFIGIAGSGQRLESGLQQEPSRFYHQANERTGGRWFFPL